MAQETIYPFGDAAVMPDGYPIANDLHTYKSNKALSAAQGVVLKQLIDEKTVGADTADYARPVECVASVVDKPLHLGQINVIRTALQHCRIKWTPIRDTMPACGSHGVIVNGRRFYQAGVEITGLNYASNGNGGRAVGSDVSVETFMTALKNPNSVLYTIDLRDTLGGLPGAYYGNNCSAFTNACQGINVVCYGRNNHFVGNKILQLPQSVEALQIGDVIYLEGATVDSGHTVIVIGIEKDENGFITFITIAQQGGTCAFTSRIARDTFEQNYILNPVGGYVRGTIYRNVNLMENDEFTQMFIGVYDESGEIPYTYSEDVGINLGNNTNFNKSDQMPIEITLLRPSTTDSFSLYKDGSLVGTYTASDGIAGYGDTVIVTIDKSQLDCGVYEVRPSSGVSQYFCLADMGTVTKSTDEKGNTVITTTGQSNNVAPYGVLLYSNRTLKTTRGFWPMKGASTATLPKGWLEFIDDTDDIAYAQVVYRNEFGNIYSDKISL